MWYLSEFQNVRAFTCIETRMMLIHHICSRIHPAPCRILFRKNIALAQDQPTYITDERILAEEKAIRDLFPPENLRILTAEDISYRRAVGDFGTEPSRESGWYEVMDIGHLKKLMELDPMSELVFVGNGNALAARYCQINYFERWELGVEVEIPNEHRDMAQHWLVEEDGYRWPAGERVEPKQKNKR